VSILPAGRLLTVREGETVKLECMAAGHPSPTVKWSKKVKYNLWFSHGPPALPAVSDLTRDNRWSTYDVSVLKKIGGKMRTDSTPSKATITNKTRPAGSFSSSYVHICLFSGFSNPVRECTHVVYYTPSIAKFLYLVCIQPPGNDPRVYYFLSLKRLMKEILQ
jgi:hypothetical protein